MKRALVLCLLALTTQAAADTAQRGDIRVKDARIAASIGAARSGAGYLSVTNTSEEADRLMAVVADFPKVMLHQTEEQDGIARMEHLADGVPLPPGATVEFAPGGTHVMFMGLTAPFVEGAEVPATLVFERAGELDIVFEVRPLADIAASDDHGGH